MTTEDHKEEKTLFVIDGNALLHRAWHALPPLTDRQGRVVNAVYGFLTILFRAVKDYAPTHLVVTFDRPGKTFRHDAYEQYKATRVKQPDELYAQIPILEEVLRAFGIPVFGVEGFEADDVLGTISKMMEKTPKAHTYILTGDLDTMQLVSPRTRVITLRKGITDVVVYDEAAVRERFGLDPKQMVDYKALRGDASDNIKGVPGVGETTATALLQEFSTLENLYEQLKKGNRGTVKESMVQKLLAHEDEALLAKHLVQIKCDLPLEFSLRRAAIVAVPRERIVDLFADLDFRSLANRIPEAMVEGAEQEIKPKSKKEKTATPATWVITDAVEAASWVKRAPKKLTVLIGAEPSVTIFEEKGITFVHGVFPVRALKAVLENPKVEKTTHDVKAAEKILLTQGIVLSGVTFDTMLADYLVAPGTRNHDLAALALTYQKKELPSLAGGQASLLEPSVQEVASATALAAQAVYDASVVLKKELDERSQSHLLRDIELPLAHVLADMERGGAKIDCKLLLAMSKDFGGRIDVLTKEIYKDAGEEFNIASPGQLKTILFEKLRIPTERIRKTATGAGLSTAASELEKLRGLHPIIEKIFAFRELSKLKNTYIDTLPTLVDASDRVHTTYNQTVAATGRLSSTEPGLQNIPIRTELGREIRRAFIAERGNRLVAADYSQVELRLMASLGNVKSMIASFKKGEDIHARTAALIWDTALEKVTPDQRRAAKAINFGILYGMGAHGLSEGAGISFAEAKEFIQKYFDAQPEVREYMDFTKALAHKQGFVETAFGRRRYLPEISSGMAQLRASAERMAINHPIQGTAADLMKIAMIRVHAELKKKCPEAKMILTVHDELVVEVEEKLVKNVAQILKTQMEGAYRAKVPLIVDLKIGKNWGEMEKT